MANKLYPNHVLENRFEDQYNSKLDLMQFCTVDDSLVGVAGDTKKINTYTATNGTQVLEMGEGNTQDIEVSYETKEYTIELLQNRFPYFDEEEMNDPLVVQKGLNHMSVDMFNTANAKAMAEFNKASLSVPVTAFNFDAFVDGAALLPFEGEDVSVFALVHKNDVKEIRKNLKDSLQYVEAYARTGYIGTVNGVSIQISNEATEGTVILATKKAVTYFTKKGTEVEQERDANIRKNTVYSRKYGIFAFTDATQAVKLVKGA
jgi:hypothetical protein